MVKELGQHDTKIAENTRDILAVAKACSANAQDIEAVRTKEAADHEAIMEMRGDLKAIRAILELRPGHGTGGARPTTEPVTRTCTEFLPPVTLCD